jgi:hypothetical protein
VSVVPRNRWRTEFKWDEEMTALEILWAELLAKLACCVCSRGFKGGGALQQHHIATGSSKRSDFAKAILCYEHHEGGAGLHHLSAPVFCRLYRVPWEKEEGLLLWTNEDIAQYLKRKGVLKL